MSKFKALEVVNCGSETQPKVIENLNNLEQGLTRKALNLII